ncbi:hypothetical protein LZ32DRAFT_655907 [Colletotrichum eremochloae]|nr:hypothetical protein LZ32DRAFT_655907 [Colletotrichum eremochloae]
MSVNRPQSISDYDRQVVLESRFRPVKIREAVYTRLNEVAEEDDDCDFARWLLLQVCEVFRDEIDDQTAAGLMCLDDREYVAGWRDALATICGLSSLCLKGPLEAESPPQPESPADSDYSHVDTEQSYREWFEREWNERWEGLDWGNNNPGHSLVVNMSAPASRNSQQGGSSSQVSQASSSLINTPSNVSISDSVLQSLFPLSSSAVSSLSSSSNGSSPSKRARSTPDSRRPPNDGHNRNLNKSDIIRGLDTNALLTHFERQSRLSERRIVAELGRTSILRQAILQDRFFGRVPSFAGAPPGNSQVTGGDGVEDDEYDAGDVADGINDPFLGEAQQVRAVRQVKTLFRQWRKTAAEAQVEEDKDSDGGTRVTGREEDSNTGVSSVSVSPSRDTKPWVKGHGEAVPLPSPASESVYSNDTLWPSAASEPEPGDDTSTLVAPPPHHYSSLMANSPYCPDPDDSSHDHKRLGETGPSSE